MIKLFDRTRMISFDVKFQHTFLLMQLRKPRTPKDSIKFDVTEWIAIYFLQLLLLTRILTFPTKKMTSFYG